MMILMDEYTLPEESYHLTGREMNRRDPEL